MFLSKYGVARHIYIPIVKRSVVDFAVGADWTPAAGDVKISKDGGAAANVTNLPVAIAMGNGALWDFSLSATELQAAQVVVTVADSATKAVEDQSFIVETYGHASGQHEFDLDTASSAQTGDAFARLGAAGAGLTAVGDTRLENLDATVSSRLASASISLSSGKVTVGTNDDKTGYGLSSAAIQAIWDALTSALSTASSIGKLLVDNLNATVSSRATPAQVNTEVLDVLNVDTFAEPGQEAPAATTTLVKKIGYLYKFLRNKITQDATTLKVYADDGSTVDQKATVSDDATTFTRGEIGTGP